MKKLTSVLLLSAALSFLSIPVFADNISGNDLLLRNNVRNISTEVTSTKEGAYKVGYAKLLDVSGKTHGDLGKELGITTNDPSLNRSIHLDNGFVTVKEFMNAKGKVVYQGIVNVEFHYQQRESK
jgi:hypothetical protein